VGKGHLQNLITKMRWFVVSQLFFVGAVLITLQYYLSANFDLSGEQELATLTGALVLLSLFFGWIITSQISQPVRFLSQAILHITPSEKLVAAPNLEKLKVGRELVATLMRQVYQFASTNPVEKVGVDRSTLLRQIPLPIIGLDANQKIVLANAQAEEYCMSGKSLGGQHFSAALDLKYEDNQTLESWVKQTSQDKVTDSKIWERVRLNIREGAPRYFDMAASLSKHHPSGTEVFIALFDHTRTYSVDDRSISFISLAVHELRTPISALRGYIEVFEEELSGKLDPQLDSFMKKMQASAESLTAFVTNILNVARVDQGHLDLTLQEENWSRLLNDTVSAMQLRASVRGKTIQLSIEKDLPTIAADRVAIAEVIINLLDNAIKYSLGDAKIIQVNSRMGEDGMIETTVRDQGIGIPSSVTPHLFEKFYRNHRSRAQIGGSGLGLYLSKAIVSAHQGNIWARSNEDRGATFGFTLLPYARLAEEHRKADNKDITRSPHGWIKNHSLSRH
jgi:two-component system sensor histidine kinase ResE